MMARQLVTIALMVIGLLVGSISSLTVIFGTPVLAVAQKPTR
jgi:hypothetical protein